MNTGRQGQAQSTLNAVRDRSQAIQQIEKQMIELAQLFQDLDNIVMEQEPLVQNIEQKGEEVRENVLKANEELGGAVVKAKSARKKKWICFWIVGECFPFLLPAIRRKVVADGEAVVLLIAIAIIIAVVVVMQNNKNKGSAQR